MTFGISGSALLVGGGALAGSLISADTARSTTNKQIDAANAAQAQQAAMLKPWTDAGTKAIGQLSEATQPGGKYTQPFTMADAVNSPAETYAQKQALQASQNSAAARGGLIGTNEQQQLQTNAAGIASQYENQAFNQWLQQNQQQLNALQSVAQVGQSSATNVADTTANLTLAAGNAAAAGKVGQNNAVAGGISSLGSQLTTLGQLFGYGGSEGNVQGIGGDYIGGSSLGGVFAGPGGIDPNNLLGGKRSAGDFSDERLKTDIKRVGYTDEGTPIYTYRMKGTDGPFKMGVMAQDIEKSNPRAVTKDPQGFRMVDYRRVS